MVSLIEFSSRLDRGMRKKQGKNKNEPGAKRHTKELGSSKSMTGDVTSRDTGFEMLAGHPRRGGRTMAVGVSKSHGP